MDYETFGAYCCIGIVLLLVFAYFYWIEKCRRDNKKRHEEFQREHKAIVESIRRQRAMIEGGEVVEPPCCIVNDDYDPMKIGVHVAPRPKPKKPKRAKPEWWRFITEESIGSLLEKRRQKKAESEARMNDPWSSR